MAIAAGPAVPLGPARLSTTTGWPRILPAASAITRCHKSIPLPAGQGMMSVMGLLGKSATLSETAGRAKADAAPIAPAPCRNFRRRMAFLPRSVDQRSGHSWTDAWLALWFVLAAQSRVLSSVRPAHAHAH